ncbi:hypothetical protein [[Pseudomonas] boreopolis]|uniref:hypothetical protein n=1 Tax=Xanthomonas boreopolis TaxID=86183 RepID=UPI003D9B8269
MSKVNEVRRSTLRYLTFVTAMLAIKPDSVLGATAQISATDRKYGARGDGNADDTAALQRAINDAVATRSPLRIPKSENYYRITRSLEIPEASQLSIVLEGVIRLDLPVGAEAVNVITGKNVKAFSLTGGGVIDGGYNVGKLRNGNGTKSTMAGLFISNSRLDGEIAHIENILFKNTFTAACSLVGFKQVELINYSAKFCGVSHQNTPYAGESIVITDADNVSIDGFHASRCMDGAGFLRCNNLIARNMNFIECGLGPDVPASTNVEIYGLNIVSPLIYGFTSIAWGAQGIQRGAKRVVIKDLKIVGKPILIDGKTYLGKGIGIDSTDYISIDGDIAGVSVGLTVSRNFLRQRFRPSRTGTVIFNGRISNCTQSAIAVEAADTVKISGQLSGNGRSNPARFAEITVSANDEQSKINELDVSVDPDTVETFPESHLLMDAAAPKNVRHVMLGRIQKTKLERLIGKSVQPSGDWTYSH